MTSQLSQYPEHIPAIPQVDMFSHKITHYEVINAENGSVMKPLKGTRGAIAHVALVNHLNTVIAPQMHTNILEKTPGKEQMEQEARLFVKRVTGTEPQGAVYWQPETTYAGQWGSHSQLFGQNYIAELEYPSDDFRRMHQGSLLVHELAHSTGNLSASTAFHLPSINLGDTSITLKSSLGMDVMKLSNKDGGYTFTDTGDFFEEAFAEETAARWREQLSPLTASRGEEFWQYQAIGVELPVRFFDYPYVNFGETIPTKIHHSALAAYAVDLLQKSSDIDLYGLMIQMRTQGTKAEAKREFIQAINSIKPGLYKELRDLKYTRDDFCEGLEKVQDLVGSAK